MRVIIDAWKIGVRIAMSSNAAAVLGVLQRDLFGLRRDIDLTTGKLNMMKVAAVGAMSAIGGAGVLIGMGKLVKAGEELVHQQALFKAALLDSGKTATQIAGEISGATALAWATTRSTLGSTAAENLKSIRELRMVFGSDAEAQAHLAPVSRAQFVMDTVRGHGAGDQVFDMAKALEIKGASMDPAHFEKLLDAMVSASVASGGKVLGSDFLSTFKYGRTATQGWDDFFATRILPTLIQEMKGGGISGGQGGPGNALMSAFAAVVGGTMSNKASLEFERLGLVDPTKVIKTTTGHVKGVQPGGILGSSEFQANPYEWVQKYLMPALTAKGITSPDAIREEVAHLFVNRTAQQIMTMFATQQVRFEKDAHLIGQAGGLNAYDQLIKEDPTAKINAFKAAWSNLITALGVPLVDSATNLLMKFTGAMNDFTRLVVDHPKLAGDMEVVVAGIAALAIAAGAFAVGTAAASALGLLTGAGGLLALAVGIQALGAALPNIPKWLIDMASGAAAGAAVGSVVPGVGTGVGAVTGGVGGLAGNIFLRDSAPPIVPAWTPGHIDPHDPFAPGRFGVGPPPPGYTPPPTRAGTRDAPQHVIVDNSRDLANGISGGQTRALNLPRPGATGYSDPRVSLGGGDGVFAP